MKQAIVKPSATKLDGFQQRSFRRLVCGVQFLLVFDSFQSSADPRTPTDATKLENTKHV